MYMIVFMFKITMKISTAHDQVQIHSVHHRQDKVQGQGGHRQSG